MEKFKNKNRIPWFGTIQNGKMELSAAGRLAWECWLEIPAHFPFISLGVFVAMPDHVHGIIIIQNPDAIVETGHAPSLPDAGAPSIPDAPSLRRRRLRSKNLGCVVGGFKSAVTKKSRLHLPDFAWQTRYYDHIIRGRFAYNAITRYIESNVENYPGLD